MFLGEDIDLWKLIQLLNCGSYGGTSIGKQAKSVILHPAAKNKHEMNFIPNKHELYRVGISGREKERERERERERE